MNLSNMIADLILDMMSESGQTEIQRNELAEKVGCVPSQINYVISSRFTPEHGYIVESRRGGGGYIKITRAKADKGMAIMHTVNNIGDTLDEKTCRAHIYNLYYQNMISEGAAKLMTAATCGNVFRNIPAEYEEQARAAIFKQMLLTTLK